MDRRVNVLLWAEKEFKALKCWIMISEAPPVPKPLDPKKTLTLARVEPLPRRSAAAGSDSEA